MSSRLDPQTPHKYAEYLLDALDGTNKELVTFDYAAHSVVWTTPYTDSKGIIRYCGMELLVLYMNVSNNGDLQRLDRSCIAEMPTFNLSVPIDYAQDLFGTDEPYNGEYNR
ncbi:hypothetical protein JG688_00016189 [Phytophthora aleatoria]|uniref:Peptidase S33 tripeptidyl aminopeptidase-like C-terminal domain-containing protein n=1 Tax=Phytophthora aleatoria TaxID=2496075 RepID=A0A8J5LZ45_9STRA|nr:hypothetical protein JG688_00016189 [Phytophthora aleatoria]